MRYLMCAIKDTAVGAYLRPFCCRAPGEAIRIFTDEVNRVDAQNPLNVHPKDFELWSVGFFDDSSGVVSAGDVRVLAVAVDVRLTE